MSTPLVTVGVVTYNSAEFIEETLDSIYNQDYQNIELVVSDDCSTDSTVEICRSWISKHESRFNGAKLVTTEKNTGVSGNSNRVLKEAHGEWYKCFDGDDVLDSHAISNYVKFVNEHLEAVHVAAKVSFINGKSVEDRDGIISKYVCSDSFNAMRQSKVITKFLFIACPTYFVNTKVLRDIGGFDERYPMQEDYPLLIKLIKAGFKLYYIDEITVYYRITDHSISHSKSNDSFFSNNNIRTIKQYKLAYRSDGASFLWRSLNSFSLFLSNLVINSGNNRKSFISSLCYKLYRGLDPYLWAKRYYYNKAKASLK